MKRTLRPHHNGKRQTVDIDLEDCIPSGARPSDRYPKPQNPPAPPVSTVMVAGTKHTYDPASDSAPCGLTKLVIPVVSSIPEGDGNEDDDSVEVEAHADADAIENHDSGSGIAIPPALKRAMDHLARRGTPISLDERSDASVLNADAETSASLRPRSSRNAPKSEKHNRIPRRLTLRSRRRSGRETRAASLARHERLCSICHHPEREEIEEAFLRWHNARLIGCDFKLQCSDMAIYRHARALGLFQLRSRNLRSSLEHVIEQAERISPTADGLVRAIRAYTRINENGEWIDTPTTHVVQVVAVPAVGRAKPALPALPVPKSSEPHQTRHRRSPKTPARRRF
jgi:hypothetical protein